MSPYEALQARSQSQPHSSLTLDWLRKNRTKLPGVRGHFFISDDLSGSWKDVYLLEQTPWGLLAEAVLSSIRASSKPLQRGLSSLPRPFSPFVCLPTEKCHREVHDKLLCYLNIEFPAGITKPWKKLVQKLAERDRGLLAEEYWFCFRELSGWCSD